MTEPVQATDTKYISILEACDLVKVSRRTIYNWINAGRLDLRKTAGGQTRIAVASLWREHEHSRAGES